MTKKERSNQRSTSSSRFSGKDRGGGAGAHASKVAPTPSSPALPRKAEERSSAPLDDGFVLVGEFGRAHSLKGEVRLKSYTADPMAIAAYGPLHARGRSISLKNARRAPGGAPDILIVQVEGVTSREAAEALNRVQLHLPRDRLPPPDEEDEFLLADLIGLPVENEAGQALGTIVDVPNYGGGDLLEIAPLRAGAQRGATAFLPFTKAFVPIVDIGAKRIVIAPPEDLFEPARPAPQDLEGRDFEGRDLEGQGLEGQGLEGRDLEPEGEA
jgi:16S rRNA processing protein RimM